MKKIIFLLVAVALSLSAQAITLFPFFVDVAGDYQEGAPAELTDVGATMKYSAMPTFYKSLDEVKVFYSDVMPFSTEKIVAKEIPMPNNEGKGMVYVSPMEDGVASIIYLLETPDKKLYIGYDEQKKE